jgi:hypothetical protein
MTKSGIVLESNKKMASIMTSDGQFIKIKVKNAIPQKGEIYSGEVYVSVPIYKRSLIAALLSFFLVFSGGLYTYYTPAAELTISINPSVKLTVNRWNRIIKYSPANEDGEKILTSIKLSNKTLDEGLNLIIDQSKVDNFINDEYKTSGKIIYINISEDKKDKINLTNLEEVLKTQNLPMEVIKSIDTSSTDKKASTTKENKKDSNNAKTDTDNNAPIDAIDRSDSKNSSSGPENNEDNNNKQDTTNKTHPNKAVNNEDSIPQGNSGNNNKSTEKESSTKSNSQENTNPTNPPGKSSSSNKNSSSNNNYKSDNNNKINSNSKGNSDNDNGRK